MKKYRVLVIGESSLFNDALERLLALQAKLEIIGHVSADIETLTAEIERTEPNVIIINNEIATLNHQLIWSLLKNYPALRIITLGLQDNHINIYNKREFTVSTTKDLVTAITGIQEEEK